MRLARLHRADDGRITLDMLERNARHITKHIGQFSPQKNNRRKARPLIVARIYIQNGLLMTAY